LFTITIYYGLTQDFAGNTQLCSLKVEGKTDCDEKNLTLNNDETNTISPYSFNADLHTINGFSVSSWGVWAWLEL
jgi:hypothetical protein